jgi:hypothetical protein
MLGAWAMVATAETEAFAFAGVAIEQPANPLSDAPTKQAPQTKASGRADV